MIRVLHDEPLPLEKAVEYAGQILDALDAAHQKGITEIPAAGA